MAHDQLKMSKTSDIFTGNTKSLENGHKLNNVYIF